MTCATLDLDPSRGRTVGSMARQQMSARQVNLLLEVAVVSAFATGLTSWAVGTGWSRWWTFAHATSGLTLLVLARQKVRRSVRPGMRRRRWTRWLSVAFGLTVFMVAVFGIAHSTGLWVGVGYWSALWSHFFFAFAAVPLFVWHLVSRPARPRRTDVDRRLVLGGGLAIGSAALLAAGVEVVSRATGLGGAGRRFTGSHEVGSFDPDRMPAVQWIDDRAPAIPDEGWPLTIAGDAVEIDELSAISHPLVATLDCTGGWWSDQSWDAVALSELVDTTKSSIRVTSSTGYSRLFPVSDADHVYLAVGYGGRPLRRGHGAPVRLVAPGRRGPWWVKWVVSVEPDDTPWWWQLPFPAT